MKAISVGILIAIIVVAATFSFAQQKRSSDILKEGLLGAGAGAVGGLASGAKGGDVWKGALAGAGVNIVGGALLDSITGEKVGSVQGLQGMEPETAYSAGYQNGFNNGYKTGYTQGFKDSVKEGATSQ